MSEQSTQAAVRAELAFLNLRSAIAAENLLAEALAHYKAIDDQWNDRVALGPVHTHEESFFDDDEEEAEWVALSSLEISDEDYMPTPADWSEYTTTFNKVETSEYEEWLLDERNPE